MNNFIGVLLTIGLIVTVAYFLYKRHRKETNTDPDNINWSKVRNGEIAISQDVKQLTPKGASVYSKKGVSDTVLTLIDTGLDGAFSDARISGYTVGLDHTLYEIFIPRYDCVPAPVSKTPSFLVRGDVYDGTEYDYHNTLGEGVKDGIGVVYVAEMVLSLGYTETGMTKGQMVCCSDESIVENATRYGAEHIIIANNDIPYFGQTWFHDSVAHPLLPKKFLPLSTGFKLNKLPDMVIQPTK